MRLIDADALKDEVMKIWAYIQCVTGDDVMDAVMTDIKNAPTVDIVKVIRCNDCKHYDTKDCADGFGWCNRNGTGHGSTDDWYCADGERKEQNDERHN